MTGMTEASVGRKVFVTYGETTHEAEIEFFNTVDGEPILTALGPLETEWELWKDGVAELLLADDNAGRGTWRWA